MKKIILITFLSLSILSCKSQQVDTELRRESTLLVSKIFDDFSNIDSNKKSISNKILYNPSTNNYKSWKDLIQKIHLILPLAINYNVKTKEDRIDYTKIFTQKEIAFMSQQATKVNSETWDDYLGIKIKKRQNNDTNKTNIFTSKTYFFTAPVFTINQDYALIYQEQRYGGSLVVYQKVKGKWQAVASAMIWVS